MADEAVRELVRKVARELLSKYAVAARRAVPVIKEKLAEVVRETLADHEVAERLRTDPRVIRQLGISNPAAAVAGVAAAVAAACKVSVEADADEVRIRLDAVRKDFRDGLDAAAASYVSNGRRGRSTVRWLEMVLFGKYEGLSVAFGVFSRKNRSPILASRTGNTIMLPLRGRLKGGFQLESAVLGTADSNWFTRAAQAALPKMAAILEAAFRRLQNDVG